MLSSILPRLFVSSASSMHPRLFASGSSSSSDNDPLEMPFVVEQPPLLSSKIPVVVEQDRLVKDTLKCLLRWKRHLRHAPREGEVL